MAQPSDTPGTPCTAFIVLGTDEYGDSVELTCDMDEDHSTSPYPAGMHHDRAARLVWADAEQW